MWIAALALIGASLTPNLQSDPANLLAPGTVTVEAMAQDIPVSVHQPFADAVERALMDAQFTALPAHARGRYIARITLSRVAKGEVAAGGSGAQASAWGGAVGVTMPSGKTQVRGLVITTLTVELVSRASGEPVWQGSALTAQAEGSRADTPAALAAKLAPAVVRSFPQALAEPVSVP